MKHNYCIIDVRVCRLVSFFCMKIRVDRCLDNNKIQLGRLDRVVLH